MGGDMTRLTPVLVLALLLLTPGLATAANVLKTAELVPPDTELPAHSELAIGPSEGWEPDRTQQAVLTALTSQGRGLRGKAIPEITVGPGPASRATRVLDDSADAGPGVLVLIVTAREPEPVDKVAHKRVRYDHRFKVTRKTELRIDFKLVDPATSSVVFSSGVEARPKPKSSPWNTDESGAIASVPDAGTMALEVLDELAIEVANAVAPRYELRGYSFRKSEVGQAILDNKILRGRIESGVEELQNLTEKLPSSADDQYNLAVALAIAKRFDEALKAADRSYRLDGAKSTSKLIEKITKWQKAHARVVACGFQF